MLQYTSCIDMNQRYAVVVSTDTRFKPTNTTMVVYSSNFQDIHKRFRITKEPLIIPIYGKFPKQLIEDNKEEYQYLDLIRSILENGKLMNSDQDRTGVGRLLHNPVMLQFDISTRIPLMTTRHMWFKGLLHELLWFVSGDTNVRNLQKNGVRIWDGNANGKELAGPIYGYQWRSWGGVYPYKNGIDQLSQIIDGLKNPITRYGTRHILNAWNPTDLSNMILPPCHVMYHWMVVDNKLNCTFFQRSSDVLLACSWNVTSATILTYMISKLTGIPPGIVTMMSSCPHIYTNHTKQAREQLQRRPYGFPTLKIHGNQQTIDDFKFDDFELVDYFAHPPLNIPMAS